jgi:hypothetical protein
MNKPALVLIITLFLTAPALAEPAPYDNVCKFRDILECTYVGKKAYLKSDKNKTVLGRIVAVTWKDIGDPVELNPTLTSTLSGYYYVIAPSSKKSEQIVISINRISVIQ